MGGVNFGEDVQFQKHGSSDPAEYFYWGYLRQCTDNIYEISMKNIPTTLVVMATWHEAICNDISSETRQPLNQIS